MAWNLRDCPQRFLFLSQPVREKAITIGNALLKTGMPPEQAARVAHERAVDWARRSSATRLPLPEHHIVPFRGGWAITYSSSHEPAYTFATQEEAIRKACKMAQGKLTDI